MYLLSILFIFSLAIFLIITSEMNMELNMVRNVLKYNAVIPKQHTYIIKKQHMTPQDEKYRLPIKSQHNDIDRKVYPRRNRIERLLTIDKERRSKSQHKEDIRQVDHQKRKSSLASKIVFYHDRPQPTNQMQPRHELVRIRSTATSRRQVVNQKNHHKSVQNDKKQHNTLNKNKNKNASQTQVKPKHSMKHEGGMRSYLEFIRAGKQVDYRLEADYEGIRRKNRKTFGDKERKVLDMLNSVFLNLYQCLCMVDDPLTPTKIQALTLLYFQCHQKVYLQFLFLSFYPQSLYPKLRPSFITQRFILYSLSLISAYLSSLSNPLIQAIKLLIVYLKQSLDCLVQKPIFKIEKEVISQINGTFGKLKAVGGVDKKNMIIQREIKRINMGRHDCRINQIEAALSPLIHTQQWALQQLTQLQMYISWTYLKVPPLPFLPLPQAHSKPYTLVLQLSQVLINYDSESKTLKYRPYLDTFLSKLSQNFQLVVYSVQNMEFVTIITRQIDKGKKIFSYLMGIQHLVVEMNDKGISNMRKDLGRIGRDIRRVVMIDNKKEENRGWKNNCIQVCEWKGDRSDMTLHNLTNILLNLQLSQINDVRQYIHELNLSRVPLNASDQPQVFQSK